MPKGDDGVLDNLDSRVERVEVLHWVNGIYRIGHRDCSRKERKDLNHGGSE